MAEQWARPFRVFWPDGGTENEFVHGVQFPSGRCVIDDPTRGRYEALESFDELQTRLTADAEVEWLGEGQEAGA